MIRYAASLGLLFAMLVPANAQERLASVQLEDGRHLEGRVLSMNLKVLEIEVGNQVIRVPATQIRSCRFQESDDPASQALRVTESEGDPLAEIAAAPAPAGESIATGDSLETGGADQRSIASGDEVKVAGKPHVTWVRPIQDPIDPTSVEAVPVDQRLSHWQRRIHALDDAYPWLAPAAPSQWLSLGLLLLVGTGLIVHMSVHVAGGEKLAASRSMGLGIWYLATGLGQVAMVPINDLSIVLMLLLNSTLSLFGLVALFGLPRLAAVVALMVQLGFAVLVYGILELVTALLGSVGVAP
jgi:hypothetical protein